MKTKKILSRQIRLIRSKLYKKRWWGINIKHWMNVVIRLFPNTIKVHNISRYFKSLTLYFRPVKCAHIPMSYITSNFQHFLTVKLVLTTNQNKTTNMKSLTIHSFMNLTSNNPANLKWETQMIIILARRSTEPF